MENTINTKPSLLNILVGVLIVALIGSFAFSAINMANNKRDLDAMQKQIEQKIDEIKIPEIPETPNKEKYVNAINGLHALLDIDGEFVVDNITTDEFALGSQPDSEERYTFTYKNMQFERIHNNVDQYFVDFTEPDISKREIQYQESDDTWHYTGTDYENDELEDMFRGKNSILTEISFTVFADSLFTDFVVIDNDTTAHLDLVALSGSIPFFTVVGGVTPFQFYPEDYVIYKFDDNGRLIQVTSQMLQKHLIDDGGVMKIETQTTQRIFNFFGYDGGVSLTKPQIA